MPDNFVIGSTPAWSGAEPETAARIVFLTACARTPAAGAFSKQVPDERPEKPFDTAGLLALVQTFASQNHTGIHRDWLS